MTAEQIKADLKSVVAEFFAEIEKLIDRGVAFDTAVMSVCRDRPDLLERENSLRDHLKALGQAEQSIAARDLRAWSESRTAGAISCGAVSKLAGAPKRLPIAELGIRYKGSQKIEITRPMISEIVSNFRKRDTGQVPIDYDHSIETAAGNGNPVPAAGWIKSIDDEPDEHGVLWGTVEWTPKAAQMIEAGEYKFISPVIDPSVRDNRSGAPQGWTLTSAALTNQPVLQGMPALVLSEIYRVYGTSQEAEQMNGNDWDAVNVEVNNRVKQVMAAKGVDYGLALQAVVLDDRDLWHRYKEAKARSMGIPDVRLTDHQGGSVASKIHALVQEKVAASEGRVDYRAGLTIVLSERPDLARQWKDTMRKA